MLAKRILDGLKDAFWPALGCSVIAIVAFAVDGPNKPNDTRPSLWQMLAVYLTMAVLSGTILGLARPMTTSTIGKGVVGFLVTLPVTGVVMLMSRDFHFHELDGADAVIALVAAMVLGPIAAAYVTIRNAQRK